MGVFGGWVLAFLVSSATPLPARITLWSVGVALVLGAGFIYRADRLAVHQSNAMARQLLMTSIVYLPLIFIVLVLDRA